MARIYRPTGVRCFRVQTYLGSRQQTLLSRTESVGQLEHLKLRAVVTGRPALRITRLRITRWA